MSLRRRTSVESASTSRISKGGKNANRVFNFNLTVLQVYWELGARTGTKIQLTVSTFTLWKHFFFQHNFGRRIWTKPFDFGSDFSSISLQMSDERWGLIGKSQNCHIKNWDIGIRRLQFREGSPEASWFEYELHIRLPHLALPIQPIPLSETVCWGAYSWL